MLIMQSMLILLEKKFRKGLKQEQKYQIRNLRSVLDSDYLNSLSLVKLK